ncbi:MAG: radical SAM family heme chaperone HemW [Clostridiales bacterium]|nr:radical SAM family heme chaperone HemW [Clostridiales bacterium]
MIPSGIYIHIPFCIAKCHYCDFYSQTDCYHLVPSYFEALSEEVDTVLNNAHIEARIKTQLKAQTIFIGGGTPSSVDASYIQRIVNKCISAFNINVDGSTEISIEANPGTISKEKLSAYASCGINRLSIGLQSSDDRILSYIGRIHNSEDYVKSMEYAQKSGFKNINTDLIYSLPGQTEQSFEESLSLAVSAGSTHISCYSLELHEGTVLFNSLAGGSLFDSSALPDDEFDRKLYWKAVEFLTERGFKHYEISNFALPGYECRHNINYWKTGTYIGLGAGAHSYFNGKRYSNDDSIESYINHKPYILHEIITTEEAQKEFMLLGLRLIEGIDYAEFYQRFGQDCRSVFAASIDKIILNGLVMENNGRLFLSNKGLDLANQVFMEFI